MRLITSASPHRLARQMRSSRGGYLRQRRAMVASTMVAQAAISFVSAYQFGLLRRMPDPDWPYIDSNEVNASDEAYSLAEMPDSFIALVSYAVTSAMAAMGDEHRHRNQPWLPIATSIKAGWDAASAAGLTWEQWARHRKFCIYCLTATAATFTTFGLSLPEARAAIRHARSGASLRATRPRA